METMHRDAHDKIYYSAITDLHSMHICLTSSTFVAQIRESPYVIEADAKPNTRQEKFHP